MVTGSHDKTIIIHTLKGKFVRSKEHLSPISFVEVSCNGVVIVICEGEQMIYAYTVNMDLIAQVSTNKLLEGSVTEFSRWSNGLRSGSHCVGEVEYYKNQ